MNKKYIIIICLLIVSIILIPIMNIIANAQTEATYEENYLRCIKYYESNSSFIKRDGIRLNTTILNSDWNITKWNYYILIFDSETGLNVTLPISLTQRTRLTNIGFTPIAGKTYMIQLVRTVPWLIYDSKTSYPKMKIPKNIPKEYYYMSSDGDIIWDAVKIVDILEISLIKNSTEPSALMQQYLLYIRKGTTDDIKGGSWRAMKCATSA